MLKILEESVDDDEQQADERRQQVESEMPKAGFNKKYVGNYRREKALKWCRVHLTTVGGDNLTLATFKDASTHEEFLWCLFQLFDEDGDQLIDQVEFLENLHKRLPDEKGRQFCEVLETATFATVRDQFITPANFAQIFATKGVLDKFYRLMNKEGTDSVKITSAMDFIAQLTVSRMSTSLTKENIEYLHEVFKENCGDNKEIGFESFRKIIHSKNNFFTERVFQMFDRDGSGSVSWQEFLDAVNDISGDSMDNRIKFLFGIYDVDGDGFIQIEELRLVLKACMDENGMKFSEEQIDDLTTALFEDADTFGRGAITLEALKAQLEKHEGLLENLTYSVGRWLVPPKPSKKTMTQRFAELKPSPMGKNYIKNNYVFMSFLFCFLAVNAALFISRAYEYREANGFVIVARACGQCLNFTCMFIVILVLRKCITFLRARGCTKVLPLDDHIYLHKLTGWFVFAYSVGHTAAHIANLAYTAALDHDDDVLEEVVEDLFTGKKGLGLVGVAYPTGVALIIILCVMVLCSQNFVRKGGRFEVFYWTHRLYVAFFVITILHTPNFWKWFVAPGIIFVIELLVRFIQRRTGHGKTVILEGVLLPSKVTHLVIKRPPNFYFHPGDYIFVKVPTIAKYEWHPFTVSSAPEQEDCLWLHIRGVGEWTNSLYTYMEKQQLKLMASKGSVNIDLRGGSKYRRRTILSHRNMSQISHKVQFTPVQSMISVGSPEVKITLSPDGENGFVNLGFGVDNGHHPLVPPEEMKEEEEEQLENEVTQFRKKPEYVLTVDSLGVDAHAKIAASKSLPPCPRGSARNSFQGLHKPASRSASSEVDSVPVLTRDSMCVRQRSRGQSFRHLRKNPQVVHLSFPSSDLALPEEDQKATGGTPVLAAPVGPTLSLTGSEGQNQMECIEEFATERPLEIFIDGPYGAPSSHIFRAEHAVLVGTGIGVTPFASILQSIMRRYWKAQQKCPRCEYCWTNNVPGVLNLKKVDFFWINRDQKSFEWFVNLLSQLEIEQAEQGGAMERFLDMHMYITSAHQKTDMQAVGLHLALDLLHEKEKRDLITGLKTRTQAGRPNWNKVFKKIAEQNKGKVTVFFCGPVQMAKSLKVTCQKFGFAFKKEIF